MDRSEDWWRVIALYEKKIKQIVINASFKEKVKPYIFIVP